MRHAGGWLVGVCLVLGAATAFADEGRVTVKLKDGKQVEGRLLGFGERTFRVEVNGRVEEFREGQVLRIEFAPGAEPLSSESPAPAQWQVRPVHCPPTKPRVVNEPGELTLSWEPSLLNACVITDHEVWWQAEGSEWELATTTQVLDSSWAPTPWGQTPRRFKVVSLARIDAEDPVVAKYGLALAEADRRQESAATEWIVPNMGVELLPVMILDAEGRRARAYVRVIKWDKAREQYVVRGFVVRVGASVGGIVDGIDYSTGLTLVSARTEERRGPAGADTVQVLVTRSADGVRREWSDAESGTAPRVRLQVVEPPATPARERILAALSDTERRIDVAFPEGTTWAEALDYVRAVTGLSVAVDPRIDLTEREVRATLRQARLADALQLLFDLGRFQAAPYCETLYLSPLKEPGFVSPRRQWSPSQAALDSEQGRRMQEVVVSVDWSSLPFEEAIEVLGEASGVNMVLTTDALKLIAYDAVDVNLQVTAVQLVNLLTLCVVRHDNLAWTVRHGAVVIHAQGEEDAWSAESTSGGYDVVTPHADEGAARTELADLNKRVAFGAHDPALFLRRGRLLRAMRRHAEAQKDFERAIELDRRSVDAWLGSSLCRRAQGDLEGALRDLSNAIEIDPARTVAREGYAIVLTELGRPERARAAVKTLTALAPNDGEVWITAARVQLALGELEEASHSLVRADALLSMEHVGLWVTRGQLLFASRELGQAHTAFTAALQYDPQNHEALIGRAHTRQAQGELTEALDDFEAAIRVDPQDAEGWLGRGVARLVTGDTERAIGDLQRATELEPWRAEAWFHLGRAFAQAGEGTVAMQAYNAALLRDPKLARVLLERAVLWAQARQFDEAERDVQRALELEPGLAERAKQVRGVIEQAKSGR